MALTGKKHEVKDESKPAQAKPAQSRDQEMYDMYAKGASPQAVADKYGLTGPEALAVIQSVQQAKRKR